MTTTTPRRSRLPVVALGLVLVASLLTPTTGAGAQDRPAPPDAGDTTDGYWMLDASGWVYAFGAAPELGNPAAPFEGRRAIDLVEHPSGLGYWVLADDGSVDAHGVAPYRGGGFDGVSLLPGERAATMSATPTGDGYWVFTTSGRAVAHGDAVHHGDLVELGLGASLNGPIVDAVAQPDGTGYYLVGTDGGVFAFGSARFAGSMGSVSLNAPVSGLVPDDDGIGYRLVAGDGGVFAFDATFRGSMGSVPLNAPVVGMIGYGDGYLMVAGDGGIFNFSDRDFVGSLGGQPLSSPIVAVAGLPTSDGTGSGAALPPGTEPGESVPIGPGIGEAPVAALSVTSDGSWAPVTVRFDGTASSDPDGRIVSWRWDLGGGVTALGPTATRTFHEPGRHVVALTVVDDSGRAAVVFDHVDVSGPVSFRRLSTKGGTFPAPPAHRHQTLALTADLSGDGVDDIVIGGRRGSRDSLVWFERTAGGWERHTIESASLRIEAGGAAADIDGDGDLDVVAGGDTTEDELWWWENPSPATPARWIRRVVKSGIANQHHDQLLADLDGDGRLELAFWNQKDGNALRVAEIPADPTTSPWPSEVVFRGAGVSEGLFAADVDGDGIDDLLGGGHWFRAGPGGWAVEEIDDAMAATRVAAGQLVPGGRPEVVFDSGDTVGPLRLYRWDGARWVGRDLLDEPSDHGHSLEVGDVDGDGHLDLLAAEMRLSDAADPQVRILYGDGAGGFRVQVVAGGTGIHEGRLADVDGDGDLDIVGKPLRPDQPSVIVWINEGHRAGVHRHVVDAAVPHRTVLVRYGDVDGDGRPDLLTGAWWWRNPGTPGGAWKRSPIGGDLRQVYVVDDLDSDGDLDVIGGDAPGKGFDGDLRWAENDGRGSFTVRSNIERADGGLLQGAVVVALRPGQRELLLSFNDGTGGLQAVSIPPPSRIRSATWEHRQVSPVVAGEQLAVGDVDGDGDADVFDGAAWFRNDAGVLERVPVVAAVAGEPDRVQLVDVDGDGDLDGVVGFGEDGTGRLRWYEQGPDPAAPWVEHIIDDLAPASALSLDAGDVDGDGDVDLVVGEHTNPAVDGLRLLLYERTKSGFERRVLDAGDEHHVGTQLVDLDRDGDLDVASIGWLHRRLLVFEQVG